MDLRCASRLTQRIAAQTLAPPDLSLVSNTLAILPPTPPPPPLPRAWRKQASLPL